MRGREDFLKAEPQGVRTHPLLNEHRLDRALRMIAALPVAILLQAPSTRKMLSLSSNYRLSIS